MNRTITALEEQVDEHNENALALLASARPAMFQGPPQFQHGIADYPSTLPRVSLGSWKGILSKKAVPTHDLVRAALGLNPQGEIAAVFSIVDNFQGLAVNVMEELPVVLCFGINYIQMPSYTSNLKLRSDTGMRSVVSKITNLKIGGFHLVAANFFPWVTAGKWQKATGTTFNSLHEMLLMNTCGFDDPVSHACTLAQKIDPRWIIFHGVDNCVPSLGMEVRRKLRRDAIFCDNISNPYSGWNEISF